MNDVGRVRVVVSMVAVLFLLVSAEPAEAQVYSMFRAEEFEFGFDDQENPLSWDASGWVGGDWNRVYFKTEGEVGTRELAVEAEAQLLYSRLISSFWEFQVGLRGDFAAGDDGRDGRGLLVVGLQGLARYWFEMDAALFLSHQGDVSARFSVSHDLMITQRLIAESSFEINVAVQEIPEFGVGAGVNDIELGLRFRYEFVREFAPYIGMDWRHTFAGTARFREATGLSAGVLSGVAGIRFWL